MDLISWSLLLTEQSQFLHKWQMFLFLIVFCVPLMNLLHSVFCWANHPRCGHASGYEREKKEPFLLPAVSSFPNYSRVPLAFFSARTHGYSIFYPGGTLSPSWQSCFPASYSLGYTGALGYSLSNAGFRISLGVAWDFSNLQRSL